MIALRKILQYALYLIRSELDPGRKLGQTRGSSIHVGDNEMRTYRISLAQCVPNLIQTKVLLILTKSNK